jgi:hypothetical protein
MNTRIDINTLRLLWLDEVFIESNELKCGARNKGLQGMGFVFVWSCVSFLSSFFAQLRLPFYSRSMSDFQLP